MVKIISFDTLSKSRRITDKLYVVMVLPEEIGLSADDCDVKPGEKVGLKYKPLGAAALAQILMSIKDVKDPHRAPAQNEGVIQECLVEPPLPPGVAGSRVLQNWMPGTIANVAGAIMTSSGYNDHEVLTAEEAVDGLGNSSNPASPSTGS